MATTACTIDHITLTTVQDGVKYEGGVTFDGDEQYYVQLAATDDPDHRTYHCANCNKDFDGAETFDEVKAHFGTFPEKREGKWKSLPTTT